ncbi:MAG: hypothetical protein M1817_002873 [Caeruleum heppii]|nr:MAG: hypothetical protein M1817_002873 [Caeruleum heppii]
MSTTPLARHCIALSSTLYRTSAGVRQKTSRSVGRSSIATAQAPRLDFLYPTWFSLRSLSCHGATPKQVHQPRQRIQRFSSKAAAQTKVLQNPRQDEEGRAMTIDITRRASTRLHEIMETDSNPSLLLRVTVESGGCHGFQYLMSLTSAAKTSEEDTIFEADDGSGAKVVMDEPSLELLRGSKIDYTMELIGSQFKIVDNPLATSSCGCGTSFDIKA